MEENIKMTDLLEIIRNVNTKRISVIKNIKDLSMVWQLGAISIFTTDLIEELKKYEK